MNNKIDWKRKLSSRKFWALLAALAVAILSGVVSEAVTAQVVGIIAAVGACVSYMAAEAKTDAANGAVTPLPMIPYDVDETEGE